jgi:hypothetical protein
MEPEASKTPAAPKKLTRKSSTPRAKKTLDPGIAAIRERMADEVAKYRSAQASKKILKTIIEKRLPKLTPLDRQALFDELSRTETPSLIPDDSATKSLMAIKELIIKGDYSDERALELIADALGKTETPTLLPQTPSLVDDELRRNSEIYSKATLTPTISKPGADHVGPYEGQA